MFYCYKVKYFKKGKLALNLHNNHIFLKM